MRYLGIEIGGTKLQVGVGTGNGPPLLAIRRMEVDRSKGAEAIRRHILELARPLIAQYHPEAIGIAFGGPIDAAKGRTLRSHHVAGWEEFPLVEWCGSELGLPAVMGNDADLAGWAEATFGAGKGHRTVFYITVGTGIGGALIHEGKIYTGAHGIAAEIGHLRPGLDAYSPKDDLESISAGWGIAAQAEAFINWFLEQRAAKSPGEHIVQMVRDRLGLSQEESVSFEELDRAVEDVLSRCNRNLRNLTTKLLGEALADENLVAKAVFRKAIRTLGWAVAQMITLLAPSAVVIGGGVALLGEKLFFEPLRQEVERYVFPVLIGRYSISSATLGEEVMIHGATLLARNAFASAPDFAA
ncbi:MAG TPA: ROK family protein [Thermogutta sp.]|nr:ROK family protein [Thermogutta sp.]